MAALDASPPQEAAPDLAGVVVEADPVAARYVGLATRALSFMIDAAVINLVAVLVGLGAALILSVFHAPGTPLKVVLAAIGGVAYIVWIVGYFVVLWSSAGQTLGARVMQIRVVASDGGPVKPHRALIRVVGMVLAAIPLFAGYALTLFDDKRRGFQDRFAGTLVVEAPQISLLAGRRAAMRAAYDATRRPPPTLPE